MHTAVSCGSSTRVRHIHVERFIYVSVRACEGDLGMISKTFFSAAE